MDSRYKSCVVNAYNRSSIPMVAGEGAFLFDDCGHKYLDFASGIATVPLGHCHPYVVKKLQEQSEKLIHCSNLFTIPEQQRLAARLVDLTFADRVFFCSSGAEAIEAAIKFIRRYYFTQGLPQKHRIITLEGGFHGRTMAAISAGGNDFSREGFAPLLPGFDRVPRNDIESLKAVISATETAAVLLEPVQGEGGVHVLDTEYLKAVRQLTQDADVLLCFDEVQCGYGRTGALFYYQMIGVEPDILTCAKGMGNGFPVAACLVKERIAAAIVPGSHGSTYGGNPLAMAVSNAVLDVVTRDGFFTKVQEIGRHLGRSLEAIIKDFPEVVTQIRGIGCIWGIELRNILPQKIVTECCAEGLLLTKSSDNKSLRILPPLVIDNSHIDDAVRIINKIIGRAL